MIYTGSPLLEAADEPSEILTAAQCRAGRSLVGMSQLELARRARLNPCTVVAFERDESQPLASTRRRLFKVLSRSGVVFIVAGRENGDGVCLRRRPKAARPSNDRARGLSARSGRSRYSSLTRRLSMSSSS